MRKAVWYFDFISPFSYLQLASFDELPGDLELTLKPVVFSALLKHWGQKGPAEIPSKRRFVYLQMASTQARRTVYDAAHSPLQPFAATPTGVD